MIPRGRFLPKVLLVGEVAGATELISEESTQEFWVGEGCALVITGEISPRSLSQTMYSPESSVERTVSHRGAENSFRMHVSSIKVRMREGKVS